MTLGRMLAALSACLLLVACGGSSHHASSAATAPTGTATAGAGAGALAPAGGTTGTSTSRSRSRAHSAHSRTAGHSRTASPPEATTARTRTTRTTQAAPAGAGNGSGGATLPAFFLIQSGGTLRPATVAAPAHALIALGVANHDHTAHTIAVVAAGHPTLHVAAGAGANTVIKSLRAGSYPVLVDGRPRGRLVVGTPGGP